MKKIITTIGLLALSLFIVAWLILPFFEHTHSFNSEMYDATNLATLAKAANMWLLVHGENKYYPPTLRSLWEDKTVTDPSSFQNRYQRLGNAPMYTTDYESIVDMCPVKITEEEGTSKVPFAWTRMRVYYGHNENWRNVVFFDSHVVFVSEEDFQKLWKEKIIPLVEKKIAQKQASEE